jgi:hypothetical protein
MTNKIVIAMSDDRLATSTTCDDARAMISTVWHSWVPRHIKRQVVHVSRGAVTKFAGANARFADAQNPRMTVNAIIVHNVARQ